jgi:hypothetical protein
VPLLLGHLLAALRAGDGSRGLEGGFYKSLTGPQDRDFIAPGASESPVERVLGRAQYPQKMDGVEMSRRLRADPATAPIPIIALSATPQWLPALPVNDRLTKPFKLGHLLAKVRYWARAPSGRRIRWRDARERSYAFDRTTGRVVASCIHGVGTRWWVVLRDSAVTYGPFDTLEQAQSEAEKCLLA